MSLPHLAFAADGDETAAPLLIAHGLFGQARNFQSIAKRLTAGRRVISIEMRNHGDAPWSEEMTYPAMAEDLAEAIDCLCDGQATVIGHSMGGKAAMALALSRPDLMAGLIVADIAPIAYSHSHLSVVQAMRALELTEVARRSDADRLLTEALPDRGLRAFVLQNLAVEAGQARWRPNLAALEAAMDTLVGFPDTFPQPAYPGRTLFLRGGASDYVPVEAEPKIRQLFPEVTFETLEGAGHWLHAEQPDAFTQSVARWLSKA